MSTTFSFAESEAKARSRPNEAIQDLIAYLRSNTSKINFLQVLDVYTTTWRSIVSRLPLDREITSDDAAFLEALSTRALQTRDKEIIYMIWNTFCEESLDKVLLKFLAAVNDAKVVDKSKLLFIVAGTINSKKIDKLVAVAKELMSQGADMLKPYVIDINLETEGGALYAACRAGNEPLVFLFIESLDKKATNYQEILDTCLCFIFSDEYRVDEINHMRLSKYLVSKGARPYVYVEKFDATAIDFAKQLLEFPGDFDKSVLRYLRSVLPSTKSQSQSHNENGTKLTDLPIKNVLAKYLNTRNTRSLVSASKSLAQVTQTAREEKEFAKLTFATAKSTLIGGKSSFHFPYNEGYSVVFEITNDACVQQLGFSGIQYNFAYLYDAKERVITLMLIDLQVLSDVLLRFHLKNKKQWYFNYMLLHREVSDVTSFTDLLDYSMKKTFDIGNGEQNHLGFDNYYVPNQKLIAKKFRSGDPFYKQVFMMGYAKALDVLGAQVNNSDERTYEGDVIGDIMDNFSKSPKQQNVNVNIKNNTENQVIRDYELQNVKQRARASVLGDYNSKVRAPFGTSQAISRFTPAQNRPKGTTLSEMISSKASNLQREATKKVANAEKQYYTQRQD